MTEDIIVRFRRNFDSSGIPDNNSVDCCTPADADVLTVTTKKCDNYCLNKRFKSFSRYLKFLTLFCFILVANTCEMKVKAKKIFNVSIFITYGLGRSKKYFFSYFQTYQN